MSIDNKLSPMMLQWQECKKGAKGALLLFRLGDFYEAFEEDAKILAEELEIVLTKRQTTPMAGIPVHSCEVYIDKLLNKGYKVAIAEQLEEANASKAIVKRGIVRILSPGGVVNSTLLSDKSSHFIITLCKVNSIFGIAILDVTTADFRVMEFENERRLLDELYHLQPKELIVSQKCWNYLGSSLEDVFFCFKQVREDFYFEHEACYTLLLNHFNVHNLDGFGLKGMTAAINAAGSLLSYVKEELKIPLHYLKKIGAQTVLGFMAIDRATERHLELTLPLHEKGKTLLSVLDHTATPMGGRLLKEWLLHPLLSLPEIRERQDRVHLFFSHPEEAEKLFSLLKEIRDLERGIMRIETGFASPRDASSLCLSLEPLPKISHLLESLHETKLEDLSDVVCLIQKALVASPPSKLNEGGCFRQGYNQELDALIDLKSKGHSWVVQYQTQLREMTQIKTLKIGYSHAFGYYIEVSRGQSHKMPENFQKRQTLVNGERFISPELKEFEHKILSAESKIAALETTLFVDLCQKITAYASLIRSVAKKIGHLDTFLSLAHVARENRYIRPEVTEEDHFFIQGGRHPVIETSLKGELFIANDLSLDQELHRFLILTGPNMAGKSTYLRQVALIAILAQMGSFVPAKKVSLGVIDKIFSRIGASDDLARGQSTFMVEMTESANILNNATSKSLVILDEIGRGTSTYDGIAIAWAVAHFLLTSKEKPIKTLFATHFSELAKLEEEVPGAINFNVSVLETQNGIVFLRKIIPGRADKSYGIHVAKLAGIPPAVIQKAEEILLKLHKIKASSSPAKKELQLELF